MDTLRTIARFCSAINEWCGRGIAWLTLGMVIVTFAVVVLRYLFNVGWIAMQESITYMHALVFMLGAAYTLKHDGHVRVDIFYARMGPKGQALVDLAGVLLLLVPVSVFIFAISWDYVRLSWELHEGSREAGGLPGVFLLKSTLLLMPVLMLLQGLAQGINALLRLNGQIPDVDQPEHGEL